MPATTAQSTPGGFPSAARSLRRPVRPVEDQHMNMPSPEPALPPASTTPKAEIANPLDLKVHAAIARATSSLSPTALLLAMLDWSSHLSGSPGKQLELLHLALEQMDRLNRYASELAFASPDSPAHECVEPPRRDRRFAARADAVGNSASPRSAADALHRDRWRTGAGD